MNISIYGNTIDYVLSSGPLGPQPICKKGHLRSALNIFSAALYGVLISAHPTMTRTPRNAKKAKVSVYKPKIKKHNAGSGSMVVLAPFKTRRGKTIYREVDAAPYYEPSNEGGKSPKRNSSKTPSHSKTTVPPLLEDTYQCEGSFPDDQEPHVPRVTKVRLRL